ncbi:unnamed protein product [marine sediment metagenome]|uniref:Uncharacterized protein n=1 Tax=marine sediment metagenome TaxID=412755 RepID=X1G2A0_9ZZZZ
MPQLLAMAALMGAGMDAHRFEAFPNLSLCLLVSLELLCSTSEGMATFRLTAIISPLSEDCL